MSKFVLIFMAMFVGSATADVIFLDADTVATGSTLDVSPLVTSLGTITFAGEIRGTADPDLAAAGSTGNVFDIVDPNSDALLNFDFDVTAISFIFGGNGGSFNILAKDILGNVVDSFFTGNTGNGAFAGPLALSGVGIRSLFWEDPGFSFAAIDNISIAGVSSVPEPMSIALLGLGLAGIGFSRKKKPA